MTQRKRVRYSTKTAERICDAVAEGRTVAEVCDRLYKGKVPASNTVYKWVNQKPEFAEMLEQARRQGMWRLHEEADYITKTPVDQLFPEIEDLKEKKAHKAARYKFLFDTLNKIAPAINPEFNSKSKLEVEHKGDGVGQVQIISYALPKEDEDNAIKDEEIVNRPTKH